jgi:excisionase family DNA binding protein
MLAEFLDRGGEGNPRKRPPFALLGPRGQRIALPESAFNVLRRSAKLLSHGDAITVLPRGKDLTLQQAAELLNVSRLYLVYLIGAGKILQAKRGQTPRIRMADVIAYKKQRDARRTAALAEISRLGQDMGGYFDSLALSIRTLDSALLQKAAPQDAVPHDTVPNPQVPS